MLNFAKYITLFFLVAMVYKQVLQYQLRSTHVTYTLSQDVDDEQQQDEEDGCSDFLEELLIAASNNNTVFFHYTTLPTKQRGFVHYIKSSYWQSHIIEVQTPPPNKA
jgi:hypothetical protein